jgi:hypothetical protein
MTRISPPPLVGEDTGGEESRYVTPIPGFPHERGKGYNAVYLYLSAFICGSNKRRGNLGRARQPTQHRRDHRLERPTIQHQSPM